MWVSLSGGGGGGVRDTLHMLEVAEIPKFDGFWYEFPNNKQRILLKHIFVSTKLYPLIDVIHIKL